MPCVDEFRKWRCRDACCMEQDRWKGKEAAGRTTRRHQPATTRLPGGTQNRDPSARRVHQSQLIVH